ncbi:PH domain-containing protein [Nocardioides solisilvae]|uniref:PH domain-containing protein n=1 Tax=Nocardioides solisilvae TaxID=1542435 RepID=UPI000D74C649|nr:PH domain-containing protein [Nocardioides solisilvae]
MAFPSKLLNDGEHVVVSTRTHPKALVGPVLVLVLVIAAVALLGTWLGDRDGATVTVAGGLAGAASVVVLVWFVLLPFLRWLTTTYTFTNRRFIKRSGIIAKEGRTIPLNRISGVDFEIGVVDRVFGCGTLIVSDASAAGRVEVHDIPRVEETQLKVAEELHQLSERADRSERRDDGA